LSGNNHSNFHFYRLWGQGFRPAAGLLPGFFRATDAAMKIGKVIS
jgi:hypothetical protein